MASIANLELPGRGWEDFDRRNHATAAKVAYKGKNAPSWVAVASDSRYGDGSNDPQRHTRCMILTGAALPKHAQNRATHGGHSAISGQLSWRCLYRKRSRMATVNVARTKGWRSTVNLARPFAARAGSPCAD